MVHSKREELQMCTSTPTSAMEDKLFKIVEMTNNVYVEPLNQFHFSVKSGPNIRYIVNLNDNTYTCKKIQLKSFLYEHVVVMAMHRAFNHTPYVFVITQLIF